MKSIHLSTAVIYVSLSSTHLRITYQLFTFFLFLVILFLLLALWHQVVQPAQVFLGEEKVEKLSHKHQCQNLDVQPTTLLGFNITKSQQYKMA